MQCLLRTILLSLDLRKKSTWISYECESSLAKTHRFIYTALCRWKGIRKTSNGVQKIFGSKGRWFSMVAYLNLFSHSTLKKSYHFIIISVSNVSSVMNGHSKWWSSHLDIVISLHPYQANFSYIESRQRPTICSLGYKMAGTLCIIHPIYTFRLNPNV